MTPQPFRLPITWLGYKRNTQASPLDASLVDPSQSTPLSVVGENGSVVISGRFLLWRGTVVERRSLIGELSLSCA